MNRKVAYTKDQSYTKSQYSSIQLYIGIAIICCWLVLIVIVVILFRICSHPNYIDPEDFEYGHEAFLNKVERQSIVLYRGRASTKLAAGSTKNRPIENVIINNSSTLLDSSVSEAQF